MKRITSYILKISITAGLLIFLFTKIDLAALLKIVRQSDPGKLILAFSIFIVLNFLIVIRWRLLLKGFDTNVGIGRLSLSYLSSLFFNVVLPSTIGGDVIRTLDIANHTKTHSSGIFATVFLDRLSGFFGLITVLILALVFRFDLFIDKSVLFVSGILLILVIFLSGIMFYEKFFNIVFKFLTFKKLKDYIHKIHIAASGFRQKKAILFWVWIISFFVQGGLSVMYYFLAEAIGVHLNIAYFMVFVPMINAFSVIPISFGGLGLRDTASVFVFSKAGLVAEKAFALSLMNFGFLIIVGLMGGISYVVTLHSRRL